MSSPAQLRYLADSVNTASPARLLVMLYDRLVLDLSRAATAQLEDDIFGASEQIRHAQLIIAELRSTLRMDVWDGAQNLSSLYGFMATELVAVCTEPDAQRTLAVCDIAAGLRDAWRAAGLAVLTNTDTNADASPTTETGTRSPAWVG